MNNPDFDNLSLPATTAGRFFRRIDWAAFWTATLVAMVVYFVTLSPSVTLEDSGELAVAGDYMGVPHPPGYPIWTILTYFFARIFEFVTFRGQPNPAWSIALSSAVFGALATGVTAMLITRSSADMLHDTHREMEERDSAGDGLLCWAGGVAGSLLFAFSPVMWSQSTIVEVYTLNALFLMLLFLFTYRWLRRPSDKILWLTAFVFGLGLTNYQVLLLAALPLVVVILLRNIGLFRDVVLVAIPFLATTFILKLGALNPKPNFPKHAELLPAGRSIGYHFDGTLYDATLYAWIAVVVATMCVAAVAMAWGRRKRGSQLSIVVPGAIASAMLLALLPLLSKLPKPEPGVSIERALLNPNQYVVILVVLAIACATALVTVLLKKDRWDKLEVMIPGATAAAMLLALLILLLKLPSHSLAAGAELDILGPRLHILIAVASTLTVMSAVVMALLKRERWDAREVIVAGCITAVMVLVLLALLSKVPSPGATDLAILRLNPETPEFEWAFYQWGFALMVISLLLLSATIPRGPMYATAMLAILIPLAVLLRKGALLGLTHPLTWWFAVYTSLNFIVLGLAWFMLPNGRTVSVMVLFAELGVSFYGFMPIFSERNPPMNWGYPRTWEGFKHAILRGQYEKIKPAGITPAFLEQLGHYFTDLRRQFTLLAAPLGFLPFTIWQFKVGKSRIRALSISIGLFLVVAALAILGKLVGASEEGPRFDKVLVGGILLLMAVGAITIVVNQIIELVRETFTDEKRPLSDRVTGGFILAGGAAVVTGLLYFSAKAIRFLLHELGNANTIYDTTGMYILIVAIVGAIILIAGVAYAAYTRPGGFRLAMDSLTQKWFIATTLGFVVMSVLLIALANPKGDVQDSFIQKVKFISSHGLFALWIGYGLVLGMTFLDVFGKGRTWVRYGMVTIALMLPLIPIYENYFNDELVRVYGGAEQNGHDYGWQFGNYQLRGAEAILEELKSDEEPLPNPTYPPGMTQRAIFFGGTDPGRFVPTYMIYSAKVRPDVFLITQNALADGTYMSVMRDLYGNDIWIPTPSESADAFKIYVDEVKTGKRPKNASLTIENGRVQVRGALGVMEINGILCDMMFKRNKALHDFYVEESYVIRWMYPYLTPHGLIMKLNDEKTKMTPKTIRDDMDFWDWYTRRLTSDKRFRRDVVAMKSFSKLRGALAGLYSSRGRLREAEVAYQESRTLYDLSPEANFRLTQEVLLRQARYSDAYDIINELSKGDPNNARIPYMLDHISKVLKMRTDIDRLQSRMKTGTLSTTGALHLAELHFQMRNVRGMMAVLDPLLKSKGNLPFPVAYRAAGLLVQAKKPTEAASLLDRAPPPADLDPETRLGIVQMYASARQPAKMIRPLAIYLKQRPNDWEAWLDLATLHLMQKDPKNARLALQHAMDLGGTEARRTIAKNKTLAQLIKKPSSPTAGLPRAPKTGPR